MFGTIFMIACLFIPRFADWTAKCTDDTLNR